MRLKTLLNGILLFLIVRFSLNCSLAPSAATETGNPDITACLSHSFTVFSPERKALPSDYLPEGEEQLDPQRVYKKPQTVIIAKKLSGSDDTVPVPSEMEITSLIDTLIIGDTTFVIDTVIVERNQYDTIVENETWGGIAGTISSESKYYDSLFIIDTVVTYDTVIFNLQQSEVDHVDDSWLNISSIQRGNNTDAYTILTGGEVAAPAISDSLKSDDESSYYVQTSGNENLIIPEVRSDSMLVTVGRSYMLDEMIVVEAYFDNDGDGYLTVPGTEQKCLAIVQYADNDTKCDLEIAFDAGADMLFASTADNRIETMYLSKIAGGTTVESVHYGEKYFGNHGDTLKMVHNLLGSTSDGIGGSRTEITYIKGDDERDHRNNKIVTYQEKVFFTKGEAENAEYTLVPSEPVQPGNEFTSAPVVIKIDFGKGLTGIVEGILDYNRKTISGTYAIAGNEFRMEFRLGMEKPVMVPIE